MTKGKTCPGCGKKTFHEPENSGLLRECSQCGAKGFPKGGSDLKPKKKGRKCRACGCQTLHNISPAQGISMFYCFTCKAMYIL